MIKFFNSESRRALAPSERTYPELRYHKTAVNTNTYDCQLLNSNGQPIDLSSLSLQVIGLWIGENFIEDAAEYWRGYQFVNGWVTSDPLLPPATFLTFTDAVKGKFTLLLPPIEIQTENHYVMAELMFQFADFIAKDWFNIFIIP